MMIVRHIPTSAELFCRQAVRCLSLVVLLLLLWGRAEYAAAQDDVQSSLYWAVPTLYNPAAAGSDSALHVAAFDRMQWVGVKNAPQTFFVSADMPVRLRHRLHGIGLTAVNDQAGLFSTTYVSGQYAYRFDLWGGRLAVGGQAGLVNQTFRGGDIYIPDGDAWEPGDDALPTGDVSAMGFDCGAGLRYERGWWYGGVGALHLTATTLDLDEYAYSELVRTYYFHAGGNIPIRRTLFLLQPSVLVKTTWQTTQVDYTLRATYDRRFWGGLTYRPGDAVVLMVGADVKTFRFGYAYDIGISPLAKASDGSHEVLVAYTLQFDLDKKKKHPHKSIRIL